MAQGPDIGSFGAGNIESGLREIKIRQFQRMYGHFSGRPVDFFAFPGNLIELFPADLDRRIHRRRLHIVSQKGICRSLQLLKSNLHAAFLQHIAGHILGVCRDSQPDAGFIFFFLGGQHLGQFCRMTEADGKHSFRIRIQGPGMTDFFLLQNSSEHLHNIV